MSAELNNMQQKIEFWSGIAYQKNTNYSSVLFKLDFNAVDLISEKITANPTNHKYLHIHFAPGV